MNQGVSTIVKRHLASVPASINENNTSLGTIKAKASGKNIKLSSTMLTTSLERERHVTKAIIDLSELCGFSLNLRAKYSLSDANTLASISSTIINAINEATTIRGACKKKKRHASSIPANHGAGGSNAFM